MRRRELEPQAQPAAGAGPEPGSRSREARRAILLKRCTMPRRKRSRVIVQELPLEEEEELEVQPAATTFVPRWAQADSGAADSAPAQEASTARNAGTGEKKKTTKKKEPPSWKQDGAVCPACVIKLVPGKGRGLVTTRAVRAGEMVAAELPAVHWVYASWRRSVCAWCLRLADEHDFAKPLPHRCRDCDSASWCSEACAAAHRGAEGDHALVCGCLRTARGELRESDDAAAVLALAAGTIALRARGDRKTERLVCEQSAEVSLNAAERQAVRAVAAHLQVCSDSVAAGGGEGPAKFGAAIRALIEEVAVSLPVSDEEEDGDDDDNSDDGEQGQKAEERAALRRWLQRLVRQEKGAALTALISVFRRFHIDLLPRFGFSAPSWL